MGRSLGIVAVAFGLALGTSCRGGRDAPVSAPSGSTQATASKDAPPAPEAAVRQETIRFEFGKFDS